MLTSKNPAASEFPDGLAVRDEVTSIGEVISKVELEVPASVEQDFKEGLSQFLQIPEVTEAIRSGGMHIFHLQRSGSVAYEAYRGYFDSHIKQAHVTDEGTLLGREISDSFINWCNENEYDPDGEIDWGLAPDNKKFNRDYYNWLGEKYDKEGAQGQLFKAVEQVKNLLEKGRKSLFFVDDYSYSGVTLSSTVGWVVAKAQQELGVEIDLPELANTTSAFQGSGSHALAPLTVGNVAVIRHNIFSTSWSTKITEQSFGKLNNSLRGLIELLYRGSEDAQGKISGFENIRDAAMHFLKSSDIYDRGVTEEQIENLLAEYKNLVGNEEVGFMHNQMASALNGLGNNI